MARFLRERFADRWFGLAPDEHRALLEELPSLGVDGGATYDAMIAATAVRARAALVSCDTRAMPVYRMIGARVSLLT